MVKGPMVEDQKNDAPWDSAMDEALELARAAGRLGDVPVGAVVVFEGEIIARAHNRREADRDPLAHAEVLALRAAAALLQRWRLWGCTLVVTLEPCPMCAGAVVNSRVDRLVFGARDPRTGAAGSIYDIVADPRLNHRPEVLAGVGEAASATLLKDFFRQRRAAKPQNI